MIEHAVRVGAATARERVTQRIGEELGGDVLDESAVAAAPTMISEAIP
jgi:hypothetical protein